MKRISLIKALVTLVVFAAICVSSYLVRDFCCRRESVRVRVDIEKGMGIPPGSVDFEPFMVESSMMYAYAREVAKGEGIPKYDTALAGMEDVEVGGQFTHALEYVLGYGYRAWRFVSGGRGAPVIQENEFGDDPAFAQWCRVNIRIWASIISGMIFLWLISLRVSYFPAALGGLLHAFSPAALARYTGQDIVRGNFSLPLIVGTFFLSYSYLSRPARWKLVAVAACAFLALAGWDMTQICFSVWLLVEIVRQLCEARKSSHRKNLLPEKFVLKKRHRLFLVLFAACMAAAVIVPYHRVHMLVLSPLMLVLFPTLFAMFFMASGMAFKRGIVVLVCSGVVFFAIWRLAAYYGGFTEHYSHFSSLMSAKIRFMNVKPSNPDLLDFDARSIWVPAMHSADRYILAGFFPMAMNCTLILMLVTLFNKRLRHSFGRFSGILFFPMAMAAFYSASFFLLVRYHVFAIIFICLLLPMLLYLWSRSSASLGWGELCKAAGLTLCILTAFNLYLGASLSPAAVLSAATMPVLALLFSGVVAGGCAGLLFLRTKGFRAVFCKVAPGVLIMLMLLTELDRSLLHVREYKEYFFAETAGLVKWFRSENIEGETVMTDFNLSPLLKAYCRARIVIQPKFELGRTREIYRRFIEIMFHGDEDDLARFCEEHGAGIFIFDKGYPEAKGLYSPRYMAAAHEIKGDSPANMMNMIQTRSLLRNFYWLRPPRELGVVSNRYIVFKVVGESDIEQSKDWVESARLELQKGDVEAASRLVRSAVFADPLSAEANLMYRMVMGKDPDISLRGY